MSKVKTTNQSKRINKKYDPIILEINRSRIQSPEFRKKMDKLNQYHIKIDPKKEKLRLI